MEYQEYLKDKDLQELLEISKSIDAEKYPENYNYLKKRIDYIRKISPVNSKKNKEHKFSKGGFFFGEGKNEYFKGDSSIFRLGLSGLIYVLLVGFYVADISFFDETETAVGNFTVKNPQFILPILIMTYGFLALLKILSKKDKSHDEIAWLIVITIILTTILILKLIFKS